MTDVKRVIIDAGHGGEEPGAMYDGRREKDDTLRLALAIGQILENNGDRCGIHQDYGYIRHTSGEGPR